MVNTPSYQTDVLLCWSLMFVYSRGFIDTYGYTISIYIMKLNRLLKHTDRVSVCISIVHHNNPPTSRRVQHTFSTFSISLPGPRDSLACQSLAGHRDLPGMVVPPLSRRVYPCVTSWWWWNDEVMKLRRRRRWWWLFTVFITQLLGALRFGSGEHL